MPPMTAHQTDRIVAHKLVLFLFYSNILNSFISLVNYIPTINLLVYWSVIHNHINCCPKQWYAILYTIHPCGLSVSSLLPQMSIANVLLFAGSLDQLTAT
jgi:hypothetical protein